MAEPLLLLEGVSVTRGGRTLLSEIGFSLASGQMAALLGPNGAGKSTLLGLCSGAALPGSGSIQLAGRPLGRWRADELARRRALLAQTIDLGFAFTVDEVVAMGRAPYRRRSECRNDADIIGWAMESSGIAHLAGRSYPTLSGGERQRVQLARVLAQIQASPGQSLAGQLLLLDEPVASLDLAHQEAVLRLARQLAAAGAAVLVVLHDLNQALRFADQLIVLANGRIVGQGGQDLLSPDFVRAIWGLDVDLHRLDGQNVILPSSRQAP